VDTPTAENISSRSEPAATLCWHVITCEYPPQSGGVGDYTQGVAAGLASEGDEVHVWCPQAAGQPRTAGQPRAIQSKTAQSNGVGRVVVHPDFGAFTPSDLARVGRQLDQFPGPRRIFVQWVPHGYGYRSMNVAFCWWLRNRAARQGDQIEIMVHEPYLRFRAGSWRQSAAALVHRSMLILLLRAARRVWISIPGWEPMCRPYALGRRIAFQWLPIPNTIPVVENSGAIQEIRRKYTPEGGPLMGHFGTHGTLITSLLEPILLALADDPVPQSVLLLGLKSEKFRDELIRKHPHLEACIHATGALAPRELSWHLAACDLMLQPYPDGVSSRRTSVMAGLSHGKPVVTTSGILTEDLWMSSGALAIAPAGDTGEFVRLARGLREGRVERERLGARAKRLYDDRFAMERTIQTLRSDAIARNP
jgi:glycosyltransferase involved in cell wall biosynthesis